MASSTQIKYMIVHFISVLASITVHWIQYTYSGDTYTLCLHICINPLFYTVVSGHNKALQGELVM